MFFNLFLSSAGPVADWISKSFPVIQTILIILITLFAIGIIVAVMVQPSKPSGGSNAILGTNDSYYAQNKSFTKEGRLKKLIVFSAIAILVLTILYFVTFKIYSGS